MAYYPDPKEINIEETPSAREFILSEGHRTVPQIYQDGKLLVEGGFMGLSKQSPDNPNAEMSFPRKVRYRSV